MVEPYVEALRFLTPLGFDILTFTIIDRLSGSGKAATSVSPHGLLVNAAKPRWQSLNECCLTGIWCLAGGCL